ncbi:hypothetical protein [Bifidobacterium leontopitheci]|uniref:Uncharacterized protein n=1 Tax=Bifidobacterium leontopitheci TaxID=2650774 RepID=A0A6I1GHD9_9BIFI|nr:hypothetical protein [Bifidobacterium leontopitheci]KAB7791074.1 hypothetical protein F7D09_0430 [Bifidobacterium leontopitheci]
MTASRTASRRAGRVAAIVAALAVVCLAAAGMLVWHPWQAAAQSSARSDDVTFAIGDDEMRLYADICAAQTCAGASAGKAAADDVTEQIRDDKALLLLAKQYGYGDATTYESFVVAMRSTNTAKSAQAKSGETVYGVTSYTPVDFHSRLITQAGEYLESKLSAKAGDPLYVSTTQAKAYFTAHRGEWTSQPTRTVLQVSLPVAAGHSAADATQQLDQALAQVTAADAANAKQTIAAALPQANVSSMTLDSSAAASPQMQDLISWLGALSAGQHTDVTAAADNTTVSAYLVTAVTQASDETDWQTYQSRIMAKLTQAKLDRLVAAKAKHVTIQLDQDKLTTILARR